jgi:hypothetical protein
MRYIAFLRAINAGPGRTVRMTVLRHAFESLGFSGVGTFGASGNIVFETTAAETRTLERRIESSLGDRRRGGTFATVPLAKILVAPFTIRSQSTLVRLARLSAP